MTSGVPVTFDSYRDFKGYVINLDHEVERYATSRKELTAVGFSNIERWPATDCRNEDVVEEIRTLGATRLERFSSDTEIACALSHLRAIRHFLTTKDHYCFIFEDDVAPVENFREMADFQDIYYGDFDLLCFGGCYAGPEYHLWGMKSDLSQLREAQAKGSTHIDDCCFWQAHAYLISRRGAYRLLQDYAEWASSIEHKKPQIDAYLSSNRNVRNKFLCNQRIANATQYMHPGDRLCGILLQKNNYERSVKNIEHMEQAAKGLTVIISGSHLESHPEITFVKEVIDSLSFTGISYDTPIILSHDRIKPGTEGYTEKEEAYQAYFNNLKEYTKTSAFRNITIFQAPEWGHLTRTLKYAVSQVKTKYMLVLQHDIHIRREIPVLEMIDLIEKHENIKHLRFNVRRNHPTFMWWDGYQGGKTLFNEEEYEGTKVCITPAWSDQNHLATKEYYENVVFPDCTNPDGELIYDFMENRLNGLCHHNHSRYGTYIYGEYGAPRTSRHSDGRKSSPEADED
jgi:hypothetical protein